MLTAVPENVAKPTLIQSFRARLAVPGILDDLRSGLIGNDAEIEGPFGNKPLVYADYVASGRALMQVEEFILREVLPFYANSHTEASYCGGVVTRLRREARKAIGER
jgi:selenocysteine lyase/cysteine desulfurase